MTIQKNFFARGHAGLFNFNLFIDPFQQVHGTGCIKQGQEGLKNRNRIVTFQPRTCSKAGLLFACKCRKALRCKKGCPRSRKKLD
ncbi:MAG: hypothetical protein R6U41_08465 [Desulfosalsimonas sp.]|uniref:hypothetical protein n=1 Tax=Desulfosalsimonas sp. TaxID=3073848 RepID=UPI003971145C